MKSILVRLVSAFALLVALAIFAVGGIRIFSDGPIAMFPGGPLSGLTASEPFPGFEGSSGGQIELEVKGWRPSSRTVLGFTFEGNLYVPSVRAESKWWPEQVLANPVVIVRHHGRLYPRRASRVTDPRLIPFLRETIANAETLASTPEMIAADTTWYFRLDPIID